jgi:arylsulfatase A-like enzyme
MVRLTLLGLVALGFASRLSGAEPNIVVILADDLGYGDVRALNPGGKIATPHLDQLAAAGLAFTDAHSPSAVCTPTRYGLLTGRYCWRTRLQSGVLGGLSPPLIEPGRHTLASLLRKQGYHTACIGKWHLGLGWQVKPGAAVNPLGIESREQVGNVDYFRPFADGPLTHGFGYFFGIAASLDMVPYTFLRGTQVWRLPTEDRDFAMMLGRDGGRTRKGPADPEFEAADVLPMLTKQAVTYIDRHASLKDGKPFLLYLPLASPHTPILPTKEWQGKSGLNPYADFVMQTDAAVGEVLAALEKHGLAENTLVIFTSDNGCSPQAKFPELRAKGHDPSAGFRGHKADIYEGGHRVPFLVRWPAKVKPGKSDRLVCLTDVFRTCAEVAGATVPDSAGEDSISFASAWTDQGPERTDVVHHSVNGSFAIRRGKWKLCLCPGSGGWSAPRPGKDDASKLPPVQLYDLAADPAEKVNRHAKHPEVVAELTKLLEKQVAAGRSTSGVPQKNAVAVDVRKAGREAMRPGKKN